MSDDYTKMKRREKFRNAKKRKFKNKKGERKEPGQFQSRYNRNDQHFN